MTLRRIASDLSVAAIVLGLGGVIGVATGKLAPSLLIAAPLSLVAGFYDRRWRRQGTARTAD